ncbi:MAG: cation diffusion facilitator family transporter [Candidatus Lokiarchaeota archaeon]|nr:cation diffusion facilitator family transporter [Candidatus Lokiarchaeota archaeon]MBD3339974.1 cation diffusion facilitator family transporter [Candidatus Lokiarchaeota archaeon]
MINVSDNQEDLKFYEKPVFLNYVLLLVNLGLFISKLFFSILSNSIALQADAFDNLTDCVMVIASLIGIVYARKKPNKKFPYGYYKVENIISLIISLFIFYTAYEILLQSITEIGAFFVGNPKKVIVSFEIFIFLIVSLVISLITTVYLKFVGKKSNSPIIKSEASEKLLDNLISSSVIVGFIAAMFNIFVLDSIIGIFISLFIFKGGYDIFVNSTKTLLDAVIDFENRTELYSIIEEFPRIKEVEKLEVRSYGKYIIVEVDVILDKEMPLYQIKDLKNKLSSKIKSAFPKIFKVQIIAQEQEKPTLSIAVPLENNEGLNSKVFDKFGDSNFFAIMELQEGEIINKEIIPNKFKDREKRKGILISDWLVSKKVDKIYLKQDLKKGPKLVFQNSMISLEITDKDYLNEIIKHEKELLKI